ncbi:MAG: hypothetical protein JKY14_04325 [Paraglaciecola sp.]|nr:hypothetical protein [Paraglaciecola sp.]
MNNVSQTQHVETSYRQSAVCEFSEPDSAWVNRAVEAWHYTNEAITQVSKIGKFDVIFFDAKCQKTSGNALSNRGGGSWVSEFHEDTVQFPDGDEMPPMVNSFTSSSHAEGGKTFFVMSVPSIWRDGGVNSDIGLEKFMVPVMLHEAMHAIQSPTYGKQIDALTKKYNLPESFNDDSVQKIFKDNTEFAQSVSAEVDLLMLAALAPTDIEARRLAHKARDMIRARYETWMIGDAEKYREIDDVWLTMEGSGQWVGYSWLSSANGGGLTKVEAIKAFGLRGKWWSQKLGFALFMAVDRLSDNWKRDAFGDGNRSVLTLLDAALDKT